MWGYFSRVKLGGAGKLMGAGQDCFRRAGAWGTNSSPFFPALRYSDPPWTCKDILEFNLCVDSANTQLKSISFSLCWYILVSWSKQCIGASDRRWTWMGISRSFNTDPPPAQVLKDVLAWQAVYKENWVGLRFSNPCFLVIAWSDGILRADPILLLDALDIKTTVCQQLNKCDYFGRVKSI